MTSTVAICGGGIGGLACALALARRGVRSVVLEQARELGEAGVGLQVATNALHVLDALGVGEATKKHALLIERMLMMDGVTGEQVIDVPCGEAWVKRFGNPYAVAHRSDVHEALLAACRADGRVELRTQAKLVGFEESPAGVRVALAAGKPLDAAALVGADGVYSTVRRQVIGDGEPLASGAIIYRAMIPAADMPQELRHPYPTLWAGPKTHIIYYPLRDWSMFNFGATVANGPADVDESSEAGLDEVLPLFAANCAEALRALHAAKRFRRFVIRHRPPADNWSRGPVTLLGDAAHPMVQYIAQGAAQALEDALVLAECVAQAKGDGKDAMSAAFQRYQSIRVVRAARVQISSLMMDRILHASAVERRVRNSVFSGRSTEEHYDRLAWLYDRRYMEGTGLA
ncbi:MAG: FAD-dependent monooxygenase [Betaproteobacteria bacterium]